MQLPIPASNNDHLPWTKSEHSNPPGNLVVDSSTSYNSSTSPSVKTEQNNEPDIPDVTALAEPTDASSKSLDVWPRQWGAYRALLGGFILMFNSWGIVNSYGTFLSYYQETLFAGSDILNANVIGATQTFVVLILSLAVGRLLDAGYVMAITATGTVLLTTGMMLLSVVNGDGGYQEGNVGLTWFTQGFAVGLGMACFFVTASFVVAAWFPRRRSFAIGIVASGASVAGLVYPMMLRYLIDAMGFNNAVRCMAGFAFFTSLSTVWLARPCPSVKPRHVESWTDGKVWIDRGALRNKPFILFTIGICFVLLGFYGIFFNLEEWAAVTRVAFKGQHPPPGDVTPGIRSYWLLVILNISSSIGRLLSSYFCDLLGALEIHTVVAIIAATLVMCLWTLSNTLTTAIVFSVLFGIFSGALIGLPPACIAMIVLTDPHGAHQNLGQWTGMMYFAAGPFALAGPIIEGHLITKYGEKFITIQMFSGVCLFIGACFILWAALSMDRDRRGRLFQYGRERKNSEARTASTAPSTQV